MNHLSPQFMREEQCDAHFLGKSIVHLTNGKTEAWVRDRTPWEFWNQGGGRVLVEGGWGEHAGPENCSK